LHKAPFVSTHSFSTFVFAALPYWESQSVSTRGAYGVISASIQSHGFIAPKLNRLTAIRKHTDCSLASVIHLLNCSYGKQTEQKGNYEIDGTEKDNLTEISRRSWFTGHVYDDTESVNVPLKSASLR